MKKTIIRRLGTFLLATALCVTAVPANSTFAADTPANVSRVFVHDPAILKANGTYYLFGSHLADAKSKDLINWTQMNFDWNWREGDSWKNDSVYREILANLDEPLPREPFAWAGYDDGDVTNGGLAVWAPNVIYNPGYVWENGSKGAYMLYYSTSSTWRRSCIAYAVSKTPEGPYRHVDTIIYSAFTKNGKVDNGEGRGSKSERNTYWGNDYLNLTELIEAGTLENVSDKWFDGTGGWNHNYGPNAIDPTVFYSKEGDMYMCYGSWSGGIFILELDKSTGAAKYPGEDGMEEVSGNFIDRYFGTHIAGGNHQSGEGPYILYDSETDYYYLYESYGGLASDGGYNMRLFRSKNVYGPYTDAAGRNAKDSNQNNDQYGIKLIGNYQFNNQPGYRAAGHNSALIDDDGQRYLFHHQRFDGAGGHQVRVRQQYLNEDDWPVNAVYEYRGEKIEHYNDNEIIGSYDLINHGTATNGDMIYSSSLALFADGTVSGAMEGTWQKSAAPGKDYDYITLNLDDTVYKGILYKQFNDESTPQKVMTFSVIGNNNTCLWGSRTTARKSLSQALVYGFNFETPASGNSISPVRHSKKNGKATLLGTASITTDTERGSKVLHMQNTGNSFQSNYLHLPADTLSTITADGFTVSMWVNVGTDTLAQSALFEANSGNKDVTEPMTRINAGLQPCTNANENTDVISCPLNRNEWHHVAYSVDTKGIRLYLDGKIIRVLSEDLSSCFDSSLEGCIQKATNVCLGSGLAFEAEDVQDVAFDDVAIYSASLSDEQIAEIYSTDTLKEAPITKSAQTISVTSNYNKTYGDKAFSLKPKLTKGNGTLSYSSGNPKIAAVNTKTGKVTIKNTGIAKITITASETEIYKKQTKTVTIKIAPKKTSLSTVKSKSAKKAVLTWKTVKNASGYRIQYATNSKFKSARTVTVSKSNTKTKTINKLTRKKTYYFRIQPYKKSGNTKIYGAYSKAKHVKIK